jgi:membrane protein
MPAALPGVNLQEACGYPFDFLPHVRTWRGVLALMKLRSVRLAIIARHPLDFAFQTLRAFRANQGLLLAGAVAYYALLSIVPLLIVSVIMLSHFVNQDELLLTIRRYLEWVAPGQSMPLLSELSNFLQHREVMGPLLFLTMLFFSSLAFTVLENAMSVIFIHRVATRKRPLLVSLLMPYCYILILALGLFLVTVVSAALEAVGKHDLVVFGRGWSLQGLSALLLYLLGVLGEIMLLTSVYLVMPVGRLSLPHALIGGVTAAVLWEITRHLLVWYLSTLSQVALVYGSLTTAIVVLLSMELAATLLLFGGQVISEFERIETEPVLREPESVHIDT